MEVSDKEGHLVSGAAKAAAKMDKDEVHHKMSKKAQSFPFALSVLWLKSQVAWPPVTRASSFTGSSQVLGSRLVEPWTSLGIGEVAQLTKVIFHLNTRLGAWRARGRLPLTQEGDRSTPSAGILRLVWRFPRPKTAEGG